MLSTSQQLKPMWAVYGGTEPVSAFIEQRMTQQDLPHAFSSVVGFCGNQQCRPVCIQCHSTAPPVYIAEELQAFVEDAMCAACAHKQLVNVKRPAFSRFDQRKLRQLVISS
jgi:hypothetical protein